MLEDGQYGCLCYRVRLCMQRYRRKSKWTGFSRPFYILAATYIFTTPTVAITILLFGECYEYHTVSSDAVYCDVNDLIIQRDMVGEMK